MQYRYQKWTLRFGSFISIGNVSWMAVRLAISLHGLGLWFVAPAAFLVPFIGIYFLFGVKIPNQEPSSEAPPQLYWSLRGDFLKFATLASAAIAVSLGLCN